MDAPNRPRQRGRSPIVAAVVVVAVLAASALGFLAAVAVAVYLTFQILTPPPPAPPVVVTPMFVANPPLIEVAPAVAPDPAQVERPVEPPPVVTPPVAVKPKFVPKPPPPVSDSSKPGPTPNNPVRPDLPHAKYDPKIDPDSFEGILSEEYPEPAAITGKIVSYLKFLSPKGDYIGQGKNQSYNLFGATPPLATHTNGVQMSAGPWALNFAPPRDTGRLKVAHYLGAKRFPFHQAKEPGLSLSGEGRGSNTLTGSFAVWQLEVEDGKVVALAVDFLQRSEGKGPPLLGRLRYKSKYE